MPKILKFVLLVLIILIFTAGCAVNYSDKYKIIDLTGSNHKQIVVRVLAKASKWRNTGTVIKKETSYDIQAEGRWRGGPICGWTGPDGLGAGTLCFFHIIPGWSISTLIGKVGKTGKAFAIGNNYQLTSSTDGILYLRINEPPSSCNDNSGYVTAKISLSENKMENESSGKTTVHFIDVRIKGMDDGIKTSKQQDYKEAVLFAKREAIERAGVEVVSVSKSNNMMLYEDYIEVKARAVLIGGYDIIDIGYSDVGIYQIVLIGKIKKMNTK